MKRSICMNWLAILCAAAVMTTTAMAQTLERGLVPVPVEGCQAMLKKLNEIIIPELNFKEADLKDVINFLIGESLKQDPDGVNIILKDEPIAGRNARICPGLRNIRLYDALKVITDLADMRFVVEPKAVVIVLRDSPYGRDIHTKNFLVLPAVISRMIPAFPQAGDASAPDARVEPALIDFLKNTGADFPPACTLKYIPALNRLVVTNTTENLEHVEEILNEARQAQQHEDSTGIAEKKKMEEACVALGMKIRDSKDQKERNALSKDLNAKLEKIFGLKQDALAKESTQAEQRAKELHEKIVKRADHKSQIIKDRFEQLTGKPGTTEW